MKAANNLTISTQLLLFRGGQIELSAVMATYSRNELRKKLAKTQRNLPTIKDNATRKLYTKKAEKYKKLLEAMNLENVERNLSNMGITATSTRQNTSRQNLPTNTRTIDDVITQFHGSFGHFKPEQEITLARTEPLEKIFQNPAAAGYKVVQTVGDGDCLIHAFLTSVSSAYRKIPFAQRSKTGGKFRRDFVAEQIDDADDKDFFKSREYLEDQHILTLGGLFNYNFIVFNQVPPPKERTRTNLPANAKNNITFLDITTGAPWILLYNKLGSGRGGDHYSAVQTPDGAFIINDYERGLAVAKELAQQTESVRQCDYNNDEIVVYRGEGYVVEERRFDDSDPPKCTALTLKNLETGALVKNIPVGDGEITKLSGGGGAAVAAKRRRTRRRYTRQRKNTQR